MYIPQKQLENLKQMIMPGKVMLIYGARRVGKTTLLNKFLEDKNLSDVLFVNGDDIVERYIDLLEKVFFVFRRKDNYLNFLQEIVKQKKA
jgi:predicted AAA+ superfamily ATPase